MVKSFKRSRKMYSKGMKGGMGHSISDTAGPVDSGNSYVLSQYGDGDTQWNNVFGPQSTSVMGNEIVNLQHPQQVPAMMYMKGGKKSRKMKKHGGQLAAVDIAPFALWGVQNMYGKKMDSRKQNMNGKKMNNYSRKMKKRGGQLTAANVAPFALWGIQNMYGKKMKSKNTK